MKTKFPQILLLLSCILTGCTAKKDRSNLANNYYHQALEAAEKNPREALDLLEKSLAEQVIPRALIFKATLLYQTKEYTESLALFEKIIKDKSYPETLQTDALNNYACLLINMGKLNQAEKVWQQLINNKHYLSPEVAWFNIGLLNLNRKAFNKAAHAFNSAIRIANDYIDAYYYLTITLMEMGEWELARKTIMELIGQMPEHQAALELLEQLNQKLKSKRPKN